MTPPSPRVDLFPAPELGNTTFLVSDPDAGVAVAIDPLRDVAQYLDRADQLGVRITHAVETHVHNDFVSGARELAAEAGAAVGAAEDSGLEFRFTPLREGSQVPVGRWRLQTRRSPGHTPNHVCYVLAGEDSEQLALFSGGALMVGAIARTDLFGPHLATHLALEAFRTLHVRLRNLPDHVVVYPTHGGGSFCAASASSEPSSTMARERATNPFLMTTDLMPFIARALHQGPYPTYYRSMAPINRAGANLLGRTLKSLPRLTADMTDYHLKLGAAMVDVRSGRDFDRGHVPGSYNVGLEGPFSAWVGWVVERGRPLVLAGGTEQQHADAHRQLLRIGWDSVVGQLDGGIDAWTASGRDLTTFETAEVADLASWILSAEPMTVIDARSEDEWVHGHVPGAVRLPVPDIPHHAHELPRDAPVAVHCGVGYRAAIAASLLEQAGFRRIVHVIGPYSDWDRLHLAATIPG
ncbi:MAG TPA: rhodanese-like domain-containing protein [Candidatus Dormibacteraeota bacterium]|nr:rhodanese-like domain-containing protein [Candidatus Dormibacteraeota bacterium]